MSELILADPVELTDAELDLVTGGAIVTGGLVNLTLTGTNINLLNGLDLTVQNITVKNIANNNDLSVGAVIQLLGGGASIIQQQA
jgi:hypothetical protein